MVWPFTSSKEKACDWNESLNKTDWKSYLEPAQLAPLVLISAGTWFLTKLHGMYLQRISGATQIRPNFFHRRSLFGKVTSVGDGDGFHLYHTPGGRLAGWGWLRQVPVSRADLKGKTIVVRIAGIDAPEGAHFGRPAQPHSTEALQWLQGYILGKRVRTYIYRRDQYDRIIATVYVRRGLFRRDVGLEMLRRGYATTYEAKTGVEFGGSKMEEMYRAAEAKARAAKIGIWARKKGFESPREYKTRMKDGDTAKESKK